MKIVIFEATWEPKCTELHGRLGTIEKSIPHSTVDVMQETRKAIACKIRVLPTVIKYDSEGMEISRLVGLKGVEILEDFFN